MQNIEKRGNTHFSAGTLFVRSNIPDYRIMNKNMRKFVCGPEIPFIDSDMLIT